MEQLVGGSNPSLGTKENAPGSSVAEQLQEALFDNSLYSIQILLWRKDELLRLILEKCACLDNTQ